MTYSYILPELDCVQKMEDAVRFLSYYKPEVVNVNKKYLFEGKYDRNEELATLLCFDIEKYNEFYDKRIEEVKNGAKDVLSSDSLLLIKKRIVNTCLDIINDKKLYDEVLKKSTIIKANNLNVLNKAVKNNNKKD